LKLDQTRLSAFWANPEKYRLAYELNLAPKLLSYGLARGSAFHIIADGRAAGQSDNDINAILRGEAATQQGGTNVDLGARPIAAAWAMYNEYERAYSSSVKVVASELEFDWQIPGSQHSMVGRLDQVLDRGGQCWIGELKTANAKAQFERTRDDWEGRAQADFVLLGARSLGYEPEGVLVRVITETAPPKVWEIEVRRSEHRLKVMQLNVHQTCEIITMLRATFGINQPWPHLYLNWPCSKPGACEYEGICRHAADTLDTSAFRVREEHLQCLRQATV
jgi:hypothetical protein